MTQGAASPRKITQPAPNSAPETAVLAAHETLRTLPPGADPDPAETADAEPSQFASITADLLIRARQAPAERPQFAAATPDLLARKGEAQPWNGTGIPAADIAAARGAAAQAAVKLKTAEAQWQEKSAATMAELTARCRTAETALAAARAERSRSEAELLGLQDQLERLRRHRDMEIAAEKLETARTLKAAEAQWQDKAARSLAELSARCRAAEAALASARAAAENSKPALAALQDQLESLRQSGDAQLAAAKLEATQALQAAETQWRDQAAQSVAGLTARCQAAEEALALAHAANAGSLETDHAQVRGLNHDINALQKKLAEREAHLEQALARLEEQRLAPPVPKPTAAWHPHSDRAVQAETENIGGASHLWRDALIVFFAVMGAVMFWPRVEQALVSAGMLDPPVRQRAVAAAVSAPVLPPPKLAPPPTVITRGVNMRADHTTGAEIRAVLKSGMPVTIIGHYGNWAQVQITSETGKTLQGWVYESYLSGG